METVEQLSLVFVDTLHLTVKHALRVNIHIILLLQMNSKFVLVVLKIKNTG